MHTFQVSDVEPGTARLPESLPEILAGTLEEVLERRVEGAASNQENAVAPGCQPLVHAAYLAFSSHLPLVLSPDDVWLCLAQGFATHVNVHAEEFRERLGMPEER